MTRKISDARKSEFDTEPTDIEYTKPVESFTSTTSKPSMNQSTVFAEDTELKGSLSFSTKLEFHGRFEGEILANGPLVIGENAVVKADINASASIIIYGKVKGNIVAKDRIELGPKAHLYGDVRSPKFMISEGAIFSGKADTLDGSAKSTDDFSNLFKRLGGAGKSSSPASSASSSSGTSSGDK